MRRAGTQWPCPDLRTRRHGSSIVRAVDRTGSGPEEGNGEGGCCLEHCESVLVEGDEKLWVTSSKGTPRNLGSEGLEPSYAKAPSARRVPGSGCAPAVPSSAQGVLFFEVAIPAGEAPRRLEPTCAYGVCSRLAPGGSQGIYFSVTQSTGTNPWEHELQRLVQPRCSEAEPGSWSQNLGQRSTSPQDKHSSRQCPVGSPAPADLIAADKAGENIALVSAQISSCPWVPRLRAESLYSRLSLAVSFVLGPLSWENNLRLRRVLPCSDLGFSHDSPSTRLFRGRASRLFDPPSRSQEARGIVRIAELQCNCIIDGLSVYGIWLVAVPRCPRRPVDDRSEGR